ncbi:MAG: dTDP-4-dehydrorhamnose reductase [Saprospiraceae bacterium]
MNNRTLKKIKIGVLGADGQLGMELRHIAPGQEHIHFDFFSKSQLDITNVKDVKQNIATNVYDYIINCAAYTAVDKAETDIDRCHNINVEGCKNIVSALENSPTKVVYISSDYVYHTYDGFPLKEDHQTAPKGIYAQSKLEGEQVFRNAKIPTLILRTSWVISSYGHNFVKTMLRLGKEKTTLNVVNDQYGAPTYARHLASAIVDIISDDHLKQDAKNRKFDDTYNFANEGFVTWCDIASYVMKIAQLNCKILPISTQDYPTPALRPQWSVMSKAKIKKAYYLEIQHWTNGVKECIEAME